MPRTVKLLLLTDYSLYLCLFPSVFFSFLAPLYSVPYAFKKQAKSDGPKFLKPLKASARNRVERRPGVTVHDS